MVQFTLLVPSPARGRSARARGTPSRRPGPPAPDRSAPSAGSPCPEGAQGRRECSVCAVCQGAGLIAACELYARAVNAIHTLNTPAWRQAGCDAPLSVRIDPSATGVHRLESGRATRQAYCARHRRTSYKAQTLAQAPGGAPSWMRALPCRPRGRRAPRLAPPAAPAAAPAPPCAVVRHRDTQDQSAGVSKRHTRQLDRRR